MTLPGDSSDVVWKTLELSDFQVIFGLSICSQMRERYDNEYGSKESLSWLIENKFVATINCAGYCELTGSGRVLKGGINRFMAENHCFPYRLAYDRTDGRFFLLRIPPLNNEILNLVLYGGNEVIVAFQCGIPSQKRYEVLMTLVREGCVKYYADRWNLTYHGTFQLLACGSKERHEVSRTEEPH